MHLMDTPTKQNSLSLHSTSTVATTSLFKVTTHRNMNGLILVATRLSPSPTNSTANKNKQEKLISSEISFSYNHYQQLLFENITAVATHMYKSLGSITTKLQSSELFAMAMPALI